ncbi:Hypothetical predicted protein [Pelobates cultripes]|uniref:Uncharacterized protein n=1 Tax=Pelobates cultripes TaxID=61616 RepID=A0AAD1RL08_PELCU|nr:Hypothetical predicted protein [Pelobates cultripes]
MRTRVFIKAKFRGFQSLYVTPPIRARPIGERYRSNRRKRRVQVTVEPAIINAVSSF